MVLFLYVQNQCSAILCEDEREISPNHKFYTSLGDEEVEQEEEEEVRGRRRFIWFNYSVLIIVGGKLHTLHL